MHTAQTTMEIDTICQLANEALSNYDFGEGVTVEAVNGWEYDSGQTEVTCAVFLKFDDDEPEDDTHLAHFTVDFDNDKVSYACCSYNGDSLGTPFWNN